MDAGNLFYKSARISPTLLEQQRIKAGLQAEAYQLTGLDGFTPGVGDFAIGVDEAIALMDQHDLHPLAANLTCGDRRFESTRTVERGGLTVGILGVVDYGDDAVKGCTTSDPAEAAREASAALVGVDLVVALVSGSEAIQKAVIEAAPGVDVIINGATRRTYKAALKAGESTWVVGSGSRGKYLGVLRLEPAPGASGWESSDATAELTRRLDRYQGRLDGAQKKLEQAEADGDEGARKRSERLAESYIKKIAELEAELAAAQAVGGQTANRLSHEVVDLDRTLEDHPGTQALVEAAQARITEVEAGAKTAKPVMGPYAGSAACSTCHAAEAAQWKTTAHARALTSLEADERHMDQSCFSCHVTGALHEDGPKRPAEVPEALHDVGCESCHGPAGEHAKNPAKGDEPAAAVAEATCVQCHDGVQDEGRFSFEDYYPRIVHGRQ